MNKEIINVTVPVATKPPPKKKKKTPKGSNVDQLQMRKVAAPVASCTTISSKKKNPPRDPVFKFKRLEYIGDVTGTTGAFGLVLNISVNPGLAAFLPWLSICANSFDMYKCNKMRFRYLNRTNTTNGGSVVIFFDPNPNDNVPTSLAQVNNSKIKCDTTPWEDASFEVPKAVLNRLNKYYVRNAIIAGDIGTYDLGTVYAITSGNASSSKCGELWVDYDIDLYEPQVETATPSSKSTSVFSSLVITAVTSAVSTTLPWATINYNPLGLIPGTGTFTGMYGTFVIYSQATIAATTVTAGTFSIYKNGSPAITAVYPPLDGGFTTANCETVLTLVPTDTFSVVVNVTGTGITAISNGGTTNILVVNSA